ncbi:MAG: S-methyl-5'-thioadenosine phosphorylase [Caldisericaceae bacterium]
MDDRIEFGVFGGSGFYSFLEAAQEVKVETPYGAPSSLVAIGSYKGRKVAFLPRHGKLHELPPHKVPYKANLWAMKSLGVTRIIAPTAVGSLQSDYKIGEFVVTDQFIDRTSGRDCTFYDGPITTHISTADPYCPELRAISIEALKNLNLPFHSSGTVVVVQGPRFSTKAESIWFTKMGWHTINMTQYPEVALARELEMCYVNIGVITDYDAGLVAEGAVLPVTQEAVVEKFNSSIDKLKEVIKFIIEFTPKERHCKCGEALKGARVGE